MGWCGDFGCTIKSSCDHRMVAGPRSCSCDACGVVCGGKYSGCKEVWAAGPRPGLTMRPSTPGRAGGRNGAVSLPDPEVRTGSPGVDVGAGAGEGAGDSFEEIQGSVLELRREMRAVLTMLSQQQAILAHLVEGRPESRPRPSRDVRAGVEPALLRGPGLRRPALPRWVAGNVRGCCHSRLAARVRSPGRVFVAPARGRGRSGRASQLIPTASRR